MADKTTHYNLNKPTGTEGPDIAALNDNADVIDSELYIRAKSWNGIAPNESGDIVADTISLAENLKSTSNQTSEGIFQIRSTGGNASVGGSEGSLAAVRGARIRTGYTPASVTLTVTGASIVATVNTETFAEAASTSGTYTFTFTSSWSPDVATYGITVNGTPTNGDVITAVYVKEVLGTITQSEPTTFISTGWNLYNYLTGYARVAKYSNKFGFGITGNYTSLAYSETYNGARTSITVSNGKFTVPNDGYVFVTGGNQTTAIWATWEDWMNGPGGDVEIYSEDVIDFSEVMTRYFPDGLMQVDNIRDEINFETGIAISVIERLDNDVSGTNLAAAKASGRAYEYDGNYIYIVRASAVQNGISEYVGSNSFAANDHGMEIVTGGTIGAFVRTLYGSNLKNKLERDVLTISAQTLTEAQKAQVRENIGIETIEIVAQALTKHVQLKAKQTVTANGVETVAGTLPTVSGYTPVGIVGIDIWDAADAGQGYGYITLGHYFVSGGKAYVMIRNISTNSSAVVSVSAFVLYIKS